MDKMKEFEYRNTQISKFRQELDNANKIIREHCSILREDIQSNKAEPSEISNDSLKINSINNKLKKLIGEIDEYEANLINYHESQHSRLIKKHSLEPELESLLKTNISTIQKYYNKFKSNLRNWIFKEEIIRYNFDLNILYYEQVITNIDIIEILKKNSIEPNVIILFDILSKDSLAISYSSIDHTNVSTIFVYDLKEKRIICKKDFEAKRIDNLKVVNNKILLHLSYEEDDCLIIMDENLQIEKTKEEFGFSDLVGANESFIYTFNYYSSCLIIFDWSFNSVKTNLYFQKMDSTEPFYIECKTINKLIFIVMINNTYILNLKVNKNEHKIFLFDKDGILINSFNSSGMINIYSKKDIFRKNSNSYIIAVFEQNAMKLFDLKGNQIELTEPFNFDTIQIVKYIFNNGKIYFLDTYSVIHIEDVTQKMMISSQESSVSQNMKSDQNSDVSHLTENFIDDLQLNLLTAISLNEEDQNKFKF